MKKNNKIITILIVIVVIALVGGLIAFSPNLINRLLGNINSTDTETNTAVKTGVILDANLAVFYAPGDDSSLIPTNGIPLKIYNGASSTITINKIIARTSCYGVNDCNYETVTIVTLNTPITIEADSDYTLDIYEDIVDNDTVVEAAPDSGMVDVGVQYVLDGNTYNIMTPMVFGLPDFDSYVGTEIPDISLDLTGDHFEFIKNPSLVNLSTEHVLITGKDDIKMDISEDLSDIGVVYGLYGDSNANWQVYHPQSREALTYDMLGGENQSNISDYFDFEYVDDVREGTGNINFGWTYENGKVEFTYEYATFKLVGTPKSTVENVTVIPGFYFRQYSEEEGYDYSSKDEGIYTIEELPSFTLTVYDKSKLKEALKNAFDKMKTLSDENCNKESFAKYAGTVIQAWTGVYERRDVTQAQIDEATNTINSLEIEMNPVANYTELDNTISKINALNRSYYAEGAFTEIDAQLARYEEGLSSNYQTKIDNLNTRLTNLYNSLEMLDADYTKVDNALGAAELLVNETDDGKELYSTESWKALENAINAVVRGKKIDEQDVVDGYAIAITNAIANLEYAPADYSELNNFLEEYESYRDMFIEETITEIDEYIKNITFDKDITEQGVVDKWYEDLMVLAENAKFKPAQGLYYSDNYEYLEIMGLMPLEGYMDFFLSANKDYYTEESAAIIEEMAMRFQSPEFEEFWQITILEQEELNQILMQLQLYVDSLEMKPGDYEELCNYYDIAINLNLSYYADTTDLINSMNNIDFNLKIDNQEKIDEMTQKLKDAINNLELKDADYTEFNKAYEKATGLYSKYYVNFSEVDAAILYANTVKGLKIDRQSEVDDATDRLNDAMSKLVLKDADYSRIENLKAIISELDKSMYTNFNVVESALNDIIYGKKANEQHLVDTMYDNLKKAYDSLEKNKADYTELNKVLENAKKYESMKDIYSNYNELQSILNSIDYNLTWDKQDVVDGYVIKINDAINNLKKKLADYTKLQELVSKIPSDYSNLDKSLQNEIELLLKEVNSLPNNLTIDEQSKIDALIVKFEALIDKLPVSSSGNVSDEVILSYLKVNGDNVNIKTKPFRYDVGYDVTSANIEVGLASSGSTSRVYGGKVLLPGENNVTIIVTTDDGKTYTYMLIINKSKTSDYLSELTIKQSDIDFNKTKQEYTIKVDKNTNKLDLSAIAEDENAKVTIKGNKNIKNGSKVYVEVESSDGSVRVYTLNVQKPGSVDIKVIVILIMILAILSGTIKFLQESKKRKNKGDA